MINIYFLIAIFFKLINFGVLIGLGIFWYRRSLRATILDLMQKKKDRYSGLEQQSVIFSAEQQQLEREKKVQEKEGKELLALVHTWRSTVEQSLDAAKKERDALHDQAVRRATLQEKNWELLMLQQAAIGPSLKNTEQILRKKYTTAKSGDQYLKPIIKELTKRV